MSKNYKRTERFATTQTNSEPKPIKKQQKVITREMVMFFLGVLFFIITIPYVIVIVFGSYRGIEKCNELGNSYLKILDKFQ